MNRLRQRRARCAPAATKLSPGASVGNMDDQISHEGQNRSAAICTTVQAALRQNRLLFAFQPVVCAATGETDYFECLLRMRDAEGGIVSGGEFITIVEEL